MPSSLEPLPNPFVTIPFNFMGYGDTGASGPAIVGRVMDAQRVDKRKKGGCQLHGKSLANLLGNRPRFYSTIIVIRESIGRLDPQNSRFRITAKRLFFNGPTFKQTLLNKMTKIDWENLGFNIMETNSYLKYVWKDGKWDSGELVRHGQNLDISLYASPFHYGQACFEGLKAFRDPQGKVRIFRPELNAKRMQKSCEAISMPFPDEKMFLDGLVRLVQDNLDFVPPYGVDGSLYIRPFVFGSSPVLGLQPSKECTFIITANPVGSYYKSGLKPCAALIKHGFDRAAPNGIQD